MYYQTRVQIQKEDLYDVRLSGVDIKAYESESDFLSEKNVYKEGISDAEGILFLYFGETEKHFWIRAKKGKLNNLRYKEFYTKEITNIGGFSCPDEHKCTTGTKSRIILSSTPTKLQLKVFNNGTPVNGAKVQMYLKESDYLNNIVPDTGDYSWYKSLPDSKPEFYDVLEKQTGVNGEVLFENFEPRRYWFRVTKDGKNNATTTFSTEEPLPDDPNITTVIDIGIK